MEKKSRVELLKIIESQKEQLSRFEKRLRGKIFTPIITHTDTEGEIPVLEKL